VSCSVRSASTANAPDSAARVVPRPRRSLLRKTPRTSGWRRVAWRWTRNDSCGPWPVAARRSLAATAHRTYAYWHKSVGGHPSKAPRLSVAYV
jgi:hypothetical protein